MENKMKLLKKTANPPPPVQKEEIFEKVIVKEIIKEKENEEEKKEDKKPIPPISPINSNIQKIIKNDEEINKIDDQFEEILSDGEIDYEPIVDIKPKFEMNYPLESENVRKELYKMNKDLNYNININNVIKEIHNNEIEYKNDYDNYINSINEMIKSNKLKKIPLTSCNYISKYYEKNINNYKKWYDEDNKNKLIEIKQSEIKYNKIPQIPIKNMNINGIIADTIHPLLYRIQVTTENVKEVYIYINIIDFKY